MTHNLRKYSVLLLLISLVFCPQLSFAASSKVAKLIKPERKFNIKNAQGAKVICVVDKKKNVYSAVLDKKSKLYLTDLFTISELSKSLNQKPKKTKEQIRGIQKKIATLRANDKLCKLAANPVPVPIVAPPEAAPLPPEAPQEPEPDPQPTPYTDPMAKYSGTLDRATIRRFSEKVGMGSLSEAAYQVGLTQGLDALVDYVLTDQTSPEIKKANSLFDLINLVWSYNYGLPPAEIKNFTGTNFDSCAALDTNVLVPAPTQQEWLNLSGITLYASGYTSKLWSIYAGSTNRSATLATTTEACRNDFALARTEKYIKTIVGWEPYRTQLLQILAQRATLPSYITGANNIYLPTDSCYTSAAGSDNLHCIYKISRGELISYKFGAKMAELQRAMDLDFDAHDWINHNNTDDYSNMTEDGLHWMGMRILLKSPNPALEKLSLFLHNYFPITINHTASSSQAYFGAMQQYLARLREFTRSPNMDFRALVKEMTRDQAMLSFLDGEFNTKSNPNENYARELMELFTLGTKNPYGVENYNHDDIVAAAQACSGITVTWYQSQNYNYANTDAQALDRWSNFGVVFGLGRFEGWKHVTGLKTIFAGKPWESRVETDYDVIDAIYDKHPNASIYLAQRLAGEYLNETPRDIEISELANVIKDNNFNLRGVLKTLFSSKALFAAHNNNAIIKSPIEKYVEVIRSLEIPYDFPTIAKVSQFSGQAIAEPPNVFGWDTVMWTNSQWALSLHNNVVGLLNNFDLSTVDNLGDIMGNIYIQYPFATDLVDAVVKRFELNYTQEQKNAMLAILNGGEIAWGNKPYLSSDLMWRLSQAKGYNLPELALRKKQVRDKLNAIFRYINNYRHLLGAQATTASADSAVDLIALKLGVNLLPLQKQLAVNYMSQAPAWNISNDQIVDDKLRGLVMIFASSNDFAVR